MTEAASSEKEAAVQLHPESIIAGNHEHAANASDSRTSSSDAFSTSRAPQKTTSSAQQSTVADKRKGRNYMPFYLISMISVFMLLYMSAVAGPGGILQLQSADKTQNRTHIAMLQSRQQHLMYSASSIARVYPAVSSNTWCIDGALRYDQAKRRPMGLCYVKLPKAASSTLTGVNKRIARNYARRIGLDNACIRHDGHVPGMYYYKRHESSFLWTSIRDPARRAMSRVTYSLAGTYNEFDRDSPLENSTTLIKALQGYDVQFGAVSSGRGGFQLQYTMLTIIDEWSAWNSTDPTRILNPPLIKKHVSQVVNGYNFIAIVERMDESLVALQLLLGLEPSDVLYLSSKVHGSYDKKGSRGKFRCVEIQPVTDENTQRELQEYFDSKEWFAKNYGDYLLYTAANMSLDRTIMDIGLVKFSDALKRYRLLKQAATEGCGPPRTAFPCSPNGTYQFHLSKSHCMAEDEGCGYKCLDEFDPTLPSKE